MSLVSLSIGRNHYDYSVEVDRLATVKFKPPLKRELFAIAMYLLEAVSLLLLQPLWGVWSSAEPSWLESIGEQKGELLSFIAANLLVLSILTRRAVDSAFDTAKIATIAAIIVAYAAAISYFDPEDVSAASLFLLNALPLFISAGYLRESFWWVVVPAVVSFFVGLAAGLVALVLFSLSISITTGVMLVCMPLSFFGSMYLLMRWRRSRSPKGLP